MHLRQYAELAAIRRSVNLGSPFGDETWKTTATKNSALISLLAHKEDQNSNKRFLISFCVPPSCIPRNVLKAELLKHCT